MRSDYYIYGLTVAAAMVKSSALSAALDSVATVVTRGQYSGHSDSWSLASGGQYGGHYWSVLLWSPLVSAALDSVVTVVSTVVTTGHYWSEQWSVEWSLLVRTVVTTGHYWSEQWSVEWSVWWLLCCSVEWSVLVSAVVTAGHYIGQYSGQYWSVEWSLLVSTVVTMLFSVGLDWPLSERFPRVTLCDFQILQLDNVQKYTVQCVLPINLFNEKIFLLIWFWLVFVAVATFVNLLHWTAKLSVLSVQV